MGKILCCLDGYATLFSLSGLSVRSTYWTGEKILVGTNAGEIFEVLASEKDKPRTIVQVNLFLVSWR